MAQESAASEHESAPETPANTTSAAPARPVEAQAAGNFDVIREFQGQIKALEDDLSAKSAALKSAKARIAELEPAIAERDGLRDKLQQIDRQRHLGKVRETIRSAVPGVDDLTVDGLIHRAGDLASDPAKEAELVEHLKPHLEKLRKADAERAAALRRVSPHPSPTARPRSFGI